MTLPRRRPGKFLVAIALAACLEPGLTAEPLSPARPPAASEFIASQRAIHQELRSGLSRLQLVCKRKRRSDAEPAQPSAPPLDTRLQERQRTTEESQQRIRSSLATSLEIARTRRGAACSPLQEFMTRVGARGALEGTECGAALARHEEMEELSRFAAEHQRLGAERLQIFQDLQRLEGEGCLRPGFAGQMLDTYEAGNAAAEASAEGFFGAWTRQALEPRAAPGAAPQQSPGGRP